MSKYNLEFYVKFIGYVQVGEFSPEISLTFTPDLVLKELNESYNSQAVVLDTIQRIDACIKDTSPFSCSIFILDIVTGHPLLQFNISTELNRAINIIHYDSQDPDKTATGFYPRYDIEILKSYMFRKLEIKENTE